MRVHIDSFSGSIADLPRRKRHRMDALRSLSTDPRVSVWERGTPWLERLLADLIASGLIVDDPAEPYPWCRFNLTDKGRALLSGTPPAGA